MQHEKKTSADEIIARLDRIIKLMEAREGLKENVPPKTPYRERNIIKPNAACAREENLTCDGFRIPGLDEVKAYAAANGFPVETAELFWNFYDGLGWRYKGSPIRNWRSFLKSYVLEGRRMDGRSEKLTSHMDAKAEERAAKRTAHIDAKMDEREKKREAKRGSGGGSRKPSDNYIKPTEADLEEVRRDFAF